MRGDSGLACCLKLLKGHCQNTFSVYRSKLVKKWNSVLDSKATTFPRNQNILKLKCCGFLEYVTFKLENVSQLFSKFQSFSIPTIPSNG